MSPPPPSSPPFLFGSRGGRRLFFLADVYGAETVQHLDDHALGEVRLEIDGLVYGTGKKAFLWFATFFFFIASRPRVTIL